MAAETEVIVVGRGRCGLATRSCIWTAQDAEGVEERTSCWGKAKEASSGPNEILKSDCMLVTSHGDR
jgi:hypothetical protein